MIIVNGADLSEDERMDLVEQLVSKIADILGLNEIPEVMYFEDDPSNCGCYYSDLNILGINICELSDPKELINTIPHELRHAFQEQRALNPETEMDYKYLTNFKNYISPLFTEMGIAFCSQITRINLWRQNQERLPTYLVERRWLHEFDN